MNCWQVVKDLKPGQTLQKEIVKHKYCKTNSLMNILSQLREGIIIDDVCIMSRYHYQDIFDTVDLRDFILGVPHSGLVVPSKTSDILRKPYLYPFVDICSRSKIKETRQKWFSRRVIQLNMTIYLMIYSNQVDIQLEDTVDSFRAFAKEELDMTKGSMLDVCQHLQQFHLSFTATIMQCYDFIIII